MRLDKYLKVSRIIKRRTVANEACDSGRVMLNDKVARASAEVKVGDVIEIAFGNKSVKVRIQAVFAIWDRECQFTEGGGRCGSGRCDPI